MEIAICSRCGVVISDANGYRDRRYRGGFRHICRSCKSKQAREWRRAQLAKPGRKPRGGRVSR